MPELSIGTITPYGRVTAKGWVNGIRYYWVLSKIRANKKQVREMIPAGIVEKNTVQL